MIYPPFFRLDERGILFWDVFGGVKGSKRGVKGQMY